MQQQQSFHDMKKEAERQRSSSLDPFKVKCINKWCHYLLSSSPCRVQYPQSFRSRSETGGGERRRRRRRMARCFRLVWFFFKNKTHKRRMRVLKRSVSSDERKWRLRKIKVASNEQAMLSNARCGILVLCTLEPGAFKVQLFCVIIIFFFSSRCIHSSSSERSSIIKKTVEKKKKKLVDSRRKLTSDAPTCVFQHGQLAPAVNR